eukprot:51840_1
MPRTFSVEHAKSNRSKCKKCKEKIPKDNLRMGVHTEKWEDEDGNEWHGTTKWIHLKCFDKAIRKKPKSKNDIIGFKLLSYNEKKTVLNYVFGENELSDNEIDNKSDNTSDIPPKIIEFENIIGDNVLSDNKIHKKKGKRKLSMDSDTKNELGEPRKKKEKIK